MGEEAQPEWFYEDAGQRKGPVPLVQLVELIGKGTVTGDTVVWRQGLSGWVPLTDTELKAHLDPGNPPPLPVSRVNNTCVWLLAFSPFLPLLFGQKYWYISALLTLALTLADYHYLESVGIKVGYMAWVWFPPLYLIRRSKWTDQSWAPFVAWLVCAIVVASVLVSIE